MEFDTQRYEAAKKRVKEIKGFYIHLSVYLLINGLFYIINTRDEGFFSGLSDFSNYSTALFWGIGLAVHWAGTFGPSLFLGRDWEEKKIQQILDRRKRQNWE